LRKIKMGGRIGRQIPPLTKGGYKSGFHREGELNGEKRGE